MKQKLGLCPKCKEIKDMTYPALSRRDNKTHICSDCGTAEAMEDFVKSRKTRKLFLLTYLNDGELESCNYELKEIDHVLKIVKTYGDDFVELKVITA